MNDVYKLKVSKRILLTLPFILLPVIVVLYSKAEALFIAGRLRGLPESTAFHTGDMRKIICSVALLLIFMIGGFISRTLKSAENTRAMRVCYNTAHLLFNALLSVLILHIW